MLSAVGYAVNQIPDWIFWPIFGIIFVAQLLNVVVVILQALEKNNEL